MNEDLEKRLDQLLADRPKPEYDLDAWLTEDETAAFDRIVSQRRRRTLTWWWGVAAAAVGVVCLTSVWLWPSAEKPAKETAGSKPGVWTEQSGSLPGVKSEFAPSKVQGLTASVFVEAGDSDEVLRKPVASVLSNVRTEPVAEAAAMEPVDSLDYYISQVEMHLTKIRDSCYEARVARLIRVDDRLQRLVNQLILDGIIADTLHQTALTE